MRSQYLAICADGIHVRNTAKYAARLRGVIAVHEVEIADDGGMYFPSAALGMSGLSQAEIACLLRGELP